VELAGGVFYVCRRIVAHGFNGTFKGAGMDETVIMVVDDYPDGSYMTLLPYFYWMDVVQPIVFDFTDPAYGGDVNIKDMTIKIMEYQDDGGNYYGPAAPWTFTWPPYPTTTAISVPVYVYGGPTGGGYFNSCYEDLRLSGGMGDLDGYNAVYGLNAIGGAVWPQEPYNPIDFSVGNHILKDCIVENFASVGYEWWFWRDSSLEIKDVIFRNIVYPAVYNNYLSNCTINISDVDIYNSGAEEVILNLNYTGDICLEDNTRDGVPLEDNCD
jgi:hypothetical protein